MNPVPRPAREGLPGRPLDQGPRLTPKPVAGARSRMAVLKGRCGNRVDRNRGTRGSGERTYGVVAANRGAAVSRPCRIQRELPEGALSASWRTHAAAGDPRSRRLVGDPLGDVADMRGTLAWQPAIWRPPGGSPMEPPADIPYQAGACYAMSAAQWTSIVPFFNFAAAILHKSWKIEVFLFATEIRRVTRNGGAKASKALQRSVPQCGGGTRIGECLDRFLRGYGNSMLGKNAVIIILSDGLDAGDPALVDSSMEPLRAAARAHLAESPAAP